MKLVLFLVLMGCASSKYLHMNKQQIMTMRGLPDREEKVGRGSVYVYAQRTYQGWKYTTFWFDHYGECTAWNVRTEVVPPETINVRVLTNNSGIAVPSY